MTAHPSQSSTLHYLYGEKTPHKGRPLCPLAALKRHLLVETATLPLLFHLAVAPSISIYTMIFLASFLSHPFPPQLSVTLSEEGIQRSDNEIMTHPFQPFKSQPFYSPPNPILCCSFILNPFFIDLLIFSCSHASDAAEEAAGLVHLFAG